MQPGQFEQTIATLQDAYAYKLPPTIDLDNFLCEQWQPNQLVFSGVMQIKTTDTQCNIVLIDQNGNEMLRIPVGYTNGQPIIYPAADSSRYFAIVVKNPTGTQQAFVGLGFKTRESSFEFKVCLQDFGKFLTRKNEQPAQLTKVDYSIHQGEKIKIQIGKNKGKTTQQPGNKVSSFQAPPM